MGHKFRTKREINECGNRIHDNRDVFRLAVADGYGAAMCFSRASLTPCHIVFCSDTLGSAFQRSTKLRALTYDTGYPRIEPRLQFAKTKNSSVTRCHEMPSSISRVTE